MTNWFDEKLGGHAPSSGETLFGKDYKPGEFLPFYVPRPDMPQTTDPVMLARFIKGLGYEVTVGETLPSRLKFHQRVNFDMARWNASTDHNRAVLVSGDNYILDGNHRAMGFLKDHDKPIAYVKIWAPFEEAIAALFDVPSTTDGATEEKRT